MLTNDGNIGLATAMGPVIGRIIQNGVAVNDILKVMHNLEKKPLINANQLAEDWSNEWCFLGEKYVRIGQNAQSKENQLTASEMFLLASKCFRAASLSNSGTVDLKRSAYLKCSKWYKQYVVVTDSAIENVQIRFKDKSLPACLHLPSNSNGCPCAIMFGGVGSSKEELHDIAVSFTKRGIAALTVDLPGLGESLLSLGYPFRLELLYEAIDNSISYCKSRDEIDCDQVGIFGLCLGGAISYKYSAVFNNVAFCVNMFPMIINTLEEQRIPAWIKKSEWFTFFSGNADKATFEEEIFVPENQPVQCPYLLIHGKEDNWTPLETALKFYELATGKKNKIIVDDEPVHGSGHYATHTIPVADQFHWVLSVSVDTLVDLLK